MKDPFAKAEVRIAVIGGGTGSFTILNSLKEHSSQIAAIVSMADDGGSSGVLRDELGALPPGDVRKCLVALSDSPKVRELFDYRFEEGTFAGHSFGNLLLTALEKMTGDFSEAVETASDILRVNGMVIPATLDNVRLKMAWPDASVELHGERVIDEEFFDRDPRKATLTLVPAATANPVAISAIEQADVVVIAPGDLYTSLGPLLVIDGIGEALRTTKAVRIYVSNLVSKAGQTDHFSVSDHAKEIERFAGSEFLDYVIYNNAHPSPALARRYADEGGVMTTVDQDRLDEAGYEAVGAPLLGKMATAVPGDVIAATRSLIRHDGAKLAEVIMSVYERTRS